MSVISLETVLRSKYQLVSRWALPEGLPPFTRSLFVIFRGLNDCSQLHVVRHFGVGPEGLVPLSEVACGQIGAVRALLPPGSVRLERSAHYHSSVYEIWVPPLKEALC